MSSAIDDSKPTNGAALTQDVRDNFAAAKTEIEALQADLAADTGTGDVVRATNPTLVGAILQALLDLSDAAAGQIQFPAAQNPSADAHTLDDYEEGTWTPNLGGTATYNFQAGEYIKIGRLCHISGRLTVNVLGTGDPNVIYGSPFANENSGHGASGQIGTFDTLALNIIWMGCRMGNNNDHLILSTMTAAGVATSDANAPLGNGSTVQFSCTFRTAA